MQWRNTSQSFGLLTKAFHWVMALIILGMLGVGFYMTSLDLSPRKFEIYNMHKAFGILILFLAILRVLWRRASPPPHGLPTHTPVEKLAATVVHVALYGAMLGLPLSGWAMSSAAQFPVSFFGLFNMPYIVEGNKEAIEFWVGIHELLVWALIGSLLLHIAGAVKHHIIDKDETLTRMLPHGGARSAEKGEASHG